MFLMKVSKTIIFKHGKFPSLVCPIWKESSLFTLVYHLSQQQLSNPHFDLVDDVDGLGTITFNLQAFKELILLLNGGSSQSE